MKKTTCFILMLVMLWACAVNASAADDFSTTAPDWIITEISPDTNGNDMPDGWELYVKHSPWNFADRTSDFCSTAFTTFSSPVQTTFVPSARRVGFVLPKS